MSTTPKEIIFEDAARNHLYRGIKTLADVVAFTLGPKGRNVGIEKSWGSPSITNDGRSIVKDITLKDQYENMGASMAKEVVEKIKENCGDGTTTGTLLLNSLVEAGIKCIASGISPIALKRGMDKAVEQIVAALEKSATPVKGSQEIRNIATVSSNGDKEIGGMIAEAMEKVGKSGVITIEEGKGTSTTIEMVEGMQFDRGYISPYFSTNMEKMVVEMERPQILVTDKKVSSIHDILPILQTIAATGAQLLIIADEIEGDALSTLVINKLRGTLRVCAVKAPGFGDRRKAMLQDIAVLTGATLISEEMAVHLKDATPEMLGSAEKLMVNKEETVIINGAGAKDKIQARILELQGEYDRCSSSYDKEKIQERRAKLAGGVAVINVGAPTETEMKEKKQRFEDALSSTKAAMEKGIVAGGGVALLRASEATKSLKLNGEEIAGADIVLKACQMPLKQIASNAGTDGSVVLTKVVEAGGNNGYNALTDKIENLIDAGVIDPAKVVISALMYAASVAGIVLISEALIGDAPDEEEK